jgi:hypothetical protein
MVHDKVLERIIEISAEKAIEMIQIKNNGTFDYLQKSGYLKDWKTPVKEALVTVFEMLIPYLKNVPIENKSTMKNNPYGNKGKKQLTGV